VILPVSVSTFPSVGRVLGQCIQVFLPPTHTEIFKHLCAFTPATYMLLLQKV
jgi:hypothetical protein